MQLGTKLGPYEILAPLGAGGMGEVYKAKDARLDRLVAIKVLPEHLAKNPDSLARFEREAKAVAALNHPNILAIHDLGKQDDLVFAVMELLDGESLRARLAHGPLPVRKATELAVQMAHGLAAAHEKGVIHRDLKPDNLWITKDGRLKILDFGLAKQATPFASGSGSLMPTESLAVLGGARTEEGMILGTVGYMSPEQVRGEAVDARSDIFSFGAVFFEMLTGRRAFARNSASDTLAAILRDDPTEVGDTSKPLPAGLHRILDHCLEKDANQRFRNAQDLAFALEALSGDSNAPAPGALATPKTPRRSQLLPLLAAAAAGALLAAGSLILLRATPQPPRPVALRYLTYSGHDSSPAVSPDGKTIAFISGRDGTSRIWIKQLKGGGEAALSTGPDNFPRFSPDGSTLLFIRKEQDHQALYRMSVLGTDPRKMADDVQYADWAPDGKQIAFVRQSTTGGLGTTGLWLMAAEGGDAHELARIPGLFMAQPRWSPDGKSLVLTKDQGSQSGSMGTLDQIDAESGTIQEIKPARTFGQVSSVAWVGDHAVIYAQAESVAGNLSVGSAMVYRHDLSTGITRPLFWTPSVSFTLDLLPDGRVVMDSNQGHESLKEVALDGKAPSRWLTQGSSFDRQPVFSPDGEWVAFSSNRSGNLDLWTLSTRTGVVRSLTDDAAEDWDPGYSPDGKHILWSSDRSGAFEIWMANSDGSSPRQVSHDGKDAENPTLTRDGEWVIYSSANPKAPGIWKVHPDGSGATRLFQGTNQSIPEVSPDGTYAAFLDQSNPLTVQLGVARIADGGKVFETPVRFFRRATEALGRSRWMPDGRHILFLGQDEKGVNGVFIQDFIPGKGTLATRKPAAGFDSEWTTESFGLSPDGKHLVLAQYDRSFSLLIADGMQGLQKATP